jgi:hypothetical protein
LKKIPYGISNFKILRKENYLYVDKTKYIEVLENYAPYQFFIRPRRFGKSLFISMLESYYDVNSQKEFNELFGDLYIGKHPTPKKNSYLIFKVSFAGIDTSSGEEKLKESFNYKIISAVQEFLDRYSNLLNEEKVPVEVNSAEIAIEYVRRISKKINRQVFVLIDEYDNFANELITGGSRSTYENLIYGEGLVRAFYKAIKDATMDNFARLFITGVSPIMLDDLTSGFNITKNLTLDERLNEAFGFTQKELMEIVREINLNKDYDMNNLLNEMMKYYNGYLFAIKGERLFNPDMALYFLDELKNHNRFPISMIDNNVKTDYARINQLAFNFKDRQTLESIMENEQIETILVERFNLSTMYLKKENFVSLLFYLGMLTIKEWRLNRVILSIPNYVIKTVYWERFYETLQRDLNLDNNRLVNAVALMREHGDITDFVQLFKEILSSLSNRDLIRMNEKAIKLILMTLLGVEGTYMVLSETENNVGYADIMLRKKVQYEEFTTFEWIIELKYLKESERQKLEDFKREGLKQLKRYVDSLKAREGLKEETLKKVLILVVGKKDVYYQFN